MSKEPLNISQEEWELIEVYLDNQLSKEQQIIVEQLKNTDPEFSNKIEHVSGLIAGIREAALIERMKVWHRNLDSDSEFSLPARKNLFSKYLIAASIFLLLGLGTWWLLRPSPAEQLFTQFYQPDPGLATVMAETNQYEFEKAMVEYKMGNYTKALKAWNLQLKQAPQNDTLQFFVGNALLALNKKAESIPHLEYVAKLPTSAFHKDACWYLGLVLLSEDKTEDAQYYIQQSNHEHKLSLLLKIKKSE